ncbi:GFA family protein [Polaromonas sp.]|uniref:GFA family protein n=1 Tax=Polaromonas sp. TaxID=1869339 RepID=UPI0025EBC0FC|nr:GFA family protein [Polaromonas sp.]
MTTQHRGSCLCKGVHFIIEGELAPIQICHCSQCRQAQGGAFGANIPVETAKLKFLSGTGPVASLRVLARQDKGLLRHLWLAGAQ